MKKFFDKFGAIWQILTSKEYVVFTINKFDDYKSAKCWISYGIYDKKDGSDVFLKSIAEYTNDMI